MATRLDVQTRRVALYESLKQACADGALSPGVMLPTVRELGERHGISANVAFGVIQNLIDEGILYTVPRVGTFVGRPQVEKVEPYLVVLPQRLTHPDNFWVQAQAGFEDRIAQLGGHSIVLTLEEALDHLHKGDLPTLSGIFATNHVETSELLEATGVPQVRFGSLDQDGNDSDRVAFDDFGGAALATRHLWQNGHRSIAFLALHNPESVGAFGWSQRRERGYRHAFQQTTPEADPVVLYPEKTLSTEREDQLRVGREVSEKLMERSDITAVIVANVIVAGAMFATFKNANWPADRWPSVVCFDDAPLVGNSVVSYLRLPWEEVGREAAQVLWERRNGRLQGATVQRLVPMRLIARLSCRSDWAANSGLAQKRVSTATTNRGAVTQQPLIAP